MADPAPAAPHSAQQAPATAATSDSAPGEAGSTRAAATVMFEPSTMGGATAASPVDAAVASGGPVTHEAHDEGSGRWQEGGPRSSRQTKPKAASKRGKRRAPAPRWGEMGGQTDEDARTGQEARLSSRRKAIIFAATAGLSLAVLATALIMLSSGRSHNQTPTAEPAPSANPPPAAHDEPAGFAVPPTPTPSPTPPPIAPPKPPSAPAPTGERARNEGAKPEPAEAEPTPSAPKSGAPSELDYRLADEAYQRGNARLFQGQTADAIKDFEEALDKNPKDPAIQRGLGLAYAQLGNAADAVRHLKAYLKAAPKANDRALVEKRIEQLRNH